MKKLAALVSLIAGVSFASDLGTSHDIILFGATDVASNSTVNIETTYKATGIVKGYLLYVSGGGPITATVSSVRSEGTRTIGTAVLSSGSAQSNVTHNLYSEAIKFTLVSGATATSTVQVTPAIIYEK